jgi:hypothetical protein
MGGRCGQLARPPSRLRVRVEILGGSRSTGIEIETNWADFAGGGDMVTNLLLQNNTVTNNGNGSGVGDTVEIIARGGNTGTNHTMNVTMFGNNLTNTGGTNVVDIYTSSSLAGSGITLNLDMNSANVPANANNTTSTAGAGGSIELRNNLASATYAIEDLGANPVASFVSTRNSNDTVNVTGIGAAITSTGAVTMPTSPSSFLMTTLDLLSPLPDANTTLSDAAAPLDRTELDSHVAAARDRWAATGLTHQQLTVLANLKFEVADLPGSYLGENGSGLIRLDSDAGGHGWSLGAAAEDDAVSAQAIAATWRPVDQVNAPAVRIDLLTAIMHEMGHALGLGDTYAEQDRDNVMYGYLTKGERRVPAPGQASPRKPTPPPQP